MDRSLVQLLNVPRDGNCLFHALQRELRGGGPDRRPRLLRPDMPDGMDGQALRDWLMEHVRVSRDVLDGLTPRGWLETLGMSVKSYVQQMRKVTDRDSWGGLVEAALVGTAVGASVLMLTARAEGYHVTAWAEAGGRNVERTICVCWDGEHWQRARLRPRGWACLMNSSWGV